MCESTDRSLPYDYLCALCGERNDEHHNQGVSICPSCSEDFDKSIRKIGWNQDKDSE